MLNEWINEGVAEYYDLIVQKWADYYTKLSPTFLLQTGQDSYQLDTQGGPGGNGIAGLVAAGDNFYKLRKLEILMSGSGVSTDSSNRWKRLFPHDVDAQHLYSQWGLVAKGFRYRLQGIYLVLAPVPQSADTLRMFYIPTWTRLVQDTDSMDFINSYEELVIQFALYRARIRQDLPTDHIEREIARLVKRVQQSSDGRDAGEPFYLSAAGPGYGLDLDDDQNWFW